VQRLGACRWSVEKCSALVDRPRPKRKLEPFLPIVHEILKQHQRAPRKQRHTAKPLCNRLPAEPGYDGGYTIVKDAVRAWRNQHAEVYMPLVHPPGEAQVDLGHAHVVLDGEKVKVAVFVMTLMYSHAVFCCVLPRECRETFLQGHRRTF
jgi:transposase